jgi:glycosyltransferase involved in cell wall biosynthesis
MAVPEQSNEEPLPDWSFLGRRVLVVSPFRPSRDGIARYAEHLIEALEPSGRLFVRLGIPPGGGDHVRLLVGWLRPLRILRYSRRADDVVVMYIPTYFQRGGTPSRVASLLALWAVAHLRRTTVVVHEIDPPAPEAARGREAVEARVLERARRLLWARGPTVVFHTEWERQRFAQRFPGRRGRTERIVGHGDSFSTSVELTQAQARQHLDLPDDRVIVLMIGFLSPHKRFDRGIDAACRAGRPDLELHIVGSPISDWPEVEQCVRELRARAEQEQGVHLHERFVTDEEFDVWIRAADAVLVPYGEASSSGVVGRAQLMGTKVIASGAGGISEQLAADDIRFSTDDELVAAIRSLPAHRTARGGIGRR